MTAAQGDARFEMEPDVRAKFLDLLALGRAGNMAHIARAVPKFGAPSLPAVALLLARWGWDLASARAGGPVRYFPDYAEVSLPGTRIRSNSLPGSIRCAICAEWPITRLMPRP